MSGDVDDEQMSQDQCPSWAKTRGGGGGWMSGVWVRRHVHQGDIYTPAQPATHKDRRRRRTMLTSPKTPPFGKHIRDDDELKTASLKISFSVLVHSIRGSPR